MAQTWLGGMNVRTMCGRARPPELRCEAAPTPLVSARRLPHSVHRFALHVSVRVVVVSFADGTIHLRVPVSVPRHALCCLQNHTRDTMGNTHVQSAKYGTQWHNVDVSTRVQHELRGGQQKLQVTNHNMGGDPCPGIQKVLHIIYTHNGARHERFIPEVGGAGVRSCVVVHEGFTFERYIGYRSRWAGPGFASVAMHGLGSRDDYSPRSCTLSANTCAPYNYNKWLIAI